MKGKKIADYINVDTISLDLKSKNKNAVIKELYEGIKDKEAMKNEELGLNDIYAREEMGSTGIEYDSLDEENVKIFFMFLCPEENTQEYLTVLARISRWIKEDKFRENLLKAKTAEEVIEIIKAEEN